MFSRPLRNTVVLSGNPNPWIQSNFLTFILQIDPAPDATIGGMLSTGCSGSKQPRNFIFLF